MAARGVIILLIVTTAPCQALIARRNGCFNPCKRRNGISAVPNLDFRNRISTFDFIHASSLHKSSSSSSYKAHLLASSSSSDEAKEPLNIIYTIQVIIGQALLIPIAFIFASVLHTPTYGLEVPENNDFIVQGIVATTPLLAMAASLDSLEKYSSELQGVTRASLRSVLYLFGKSRKIFIAIFVSLLISIAAGFGEEIMFRGVLLTQVLSFLQSQSSAAPWLDVAWISGIHIDEWIAILISSILFGAVHLITFTYAAIATIAGVYFGYLEVSHDHSLAVPIVTHSLYDFVALLYAHFVVTNMTNKERQDLMKENE